VLRWLAPIPLLRTFSVFAADALTGAGHQPARTGVQVLVGTINVACNLALIPMFQWRGAAISSLVCDFLLASLLWLLIGRIKSSDQRNLAANRTSYA
jgi:O-antigen/teichoic acid export membrane protein